MLKRLQVLFGVVLLAGGLTVVLFGAAFPSPSAPVALGWLLFAPLLVSIAGVGLLIAGLAQGLGGGRSAANLRIVGMTGLVGLGLAFAFVAAGIASQIPDTAAGLNGSYVPGPAPGLSAVLSGVVGLSVGVAVGSATAIIRGWSQRRRRPEAPA